MKTGSTYNFAFITDRNVVPKPKWGYKVSCMYMTSTDSGRHYRLANTQDGGQ